MIRAIIFDLDGTIADTEPLHYEAFAQVVRTQGIEITLKDYIERLIGYDDRGCFETVLRENGRTVNDAVIRRLIDHKAGFTGPMIAEREVIYPGAADFVRRCAERFPLMLVTGTLRHEAEAILRWRRPAPLFLDMIAAEDVAQGKPAPDGFLTALGRLGFILRPHPSINADECLVFEDTVCRRDGRARPGCISLAFCQTATPRNLQAPIDSSVHWRGGSRQHPAPLR